MNHVLTCQFCVQRGVDNSLKWETFLKMSIFHRIDQFIVANWWLKNLFYLIFWSIFYNRLSKYSILVFYEIKTKLAFNLDKPCILREEDWTNVPEKVLYIFLPRNILIGTMNSIFLTQASRPYYLWKSIQPQILVTRIWSLGHGYISET